VSITRVSDGVFVTLTVQWLIQYMSHRYAQVLYGPYFKTKKREI